MSDADSNGTQSVEKAAAPAFEEVLAQAERLIGNSDLNGALALLLALELDYVRGARLFSLLGDVFLQKGETQLGVRYKVLHEILRGTLKIAMEETQGKGDPSSVFARQPGLDEIGFGHSEPGEGRTGTDFMPITAAMGEELMRQGHYDRALQIFMTLLVKNPQDPGLKKSRDQAKKRLSEKKILKVLQGWLGNLDKIKSGETTGA
jgi:hypothetical protein